MDRLKQFFVMPFATLLFVATLHSGWAIYQTGFNSAWLGALIAVLPGACFFSAVMLKQFARTSSNLPALILSGVVGSLLALFLPAAGALPLFYAIGVGLVGTLIYVFWYSRLGDRSNALLTKGNVLPDFEVRDADGKVVSAATIRSSPALMLFFRGNWCPLCMVQVKEIAAKYRELHERGIATYLISPQSEGQTGTLAAKFDVPMQFLSDKGSAAARALGILHENGTPVGMLGYDSDTVLPTAIMTDGEGQIIFADMTDNYRVRPEPQTFIDLYDAHVAQ